jgi:hypothetical protein
MTLADDGNTNDNPFHPELVKKLISCGLKSNTNPSATGATTTPHLTKEAAVLTAELLHAFVQEARHRASIEAECDQEGGLDPDANTSSNTMIRADHITKIAAELFMDFS